jgi:nitrogen fixation NifU-like protein
MYSESLIDYFRNPRGVGELPPPATIIDVENPICGDRLRLSVLYEDGRISEARFKTRGCTASIAAGSALTEWLNGRTRAEIAAFSTEVIEAALGGLPNESKHAAVLCQDSMRALLLALPK